MTAIVSPLWRWLLTDINGAPLTVLDHLASDRIVTAKLNEPMEISGSVPSDNSEVNRLHTDGFPFLAEGVRQLYCFRRESDTAPFFTIRGSGLVMQVTDAAAQDDARSRFTAWDPWMYLNSRLVLQSQAAMVNGAPGVNNRLIPEQGMIYPDTMTADQIIFDILITMATTFPPGLTLPTVPGVAQFGFIDFISGLGTIQTCGSFTGGWKIEQGTTVGQALTDIVSTGYCDIVLEPIYELLLGIVPGFLSRLNIYSQAGGALGAGSYNYAARFAWDRPGRTLVGVENQYDGTGRANYIQYMNGQGGPPVTPVYDAPSLAIYGEYDSQQFFPAHTYASAVESIAAFQLNLRKNFKETLTVNPAPDRAPEPFVDYNIGDAVPQFMSDRMRQPLPPVANPTNVWQRVYGIPVEIDDNGTETVRELIVGPVGEPPPVEEDTIATEFSIAAIQANRTSRVVRGGSVAGN